MPPDTASAPRTPASAAEARQRAHDALDRAFTTRTVRGEEATGVNLSLLTDQLRYEGVPIEVRRRDRPDPDPSAEAATKSVAGATAGRPAHYGRPAAAERHRHGGPPFGTGSRVRAVAGAPVDVVPDLEGEVRQVFKRGGMWLADVQWDNGALDEGLSCGWLELAIGLPQSAFAVAVRKETGQGLVTVVVGGHRIDVEWHPDDEHAALIQRALSTAQIAAPSPGEPWRWWQLRTEEGKLLDPAANCGLDFDASATLFLDPYAGGGAFDDLTRRLAAGDGWKGTMPARGTRRRVIYDTLLHTKVKLADGIAREPGLLDRDEGVQLLADAIESSLLQATIDEEAMARGAEALTDGIVSAIPAEPGPRDGELRIVLEDVSAADRPPEYRFVELEDGEGRGLRLPMQPSERKPFLEIVIPPGVLILTAQGLLTAAQRLPEHAYRQLEKALAWDVENLADVPEDAVPPESIALTERSGRRIAKALETLAVSTGGALRELLDRTATDRKGS